LPFFKIKSDSKKNNEIALYIAPVSMYKKFNFLANDLAKVLLPQPECPSIVITVFFI
jgi:hypothetical protein